MLKAIFKVKTKEKILLLTNSCKLIELDNQGKRYSFKYSQLTATRRKVVSTGINARYHRC